MHRNVVVAPLGVQVADIDEGGAVEAVPVDLVQHEDVVIDALGLDELVNVGGKCEEFLEAVPKRDENGQAVFAF